MVTRTATITVDDGRPFYGLGAEVVRLVHPNTLGSDNLGVSLCRMAPGEAICTHRHDYEEAYFVLTGTGRMYLEDVGTIRLVPGLSVYIPSRRVHGQVNDGDEPLHILCSLSPPPQEGVTPELVPVEGWA
jgi:quercetin dioxygenase-like cupin family protein